MYERALDRLPEKFATHPKVAQVIRDFRQHLREERLYGSSEEMRRVSSKYVDWFNKQLHANYGTSFTDLMR